MKRASLDNLEVLFILDLKIWLKSQWWLTLISRNLQLESENWLESAGKETEYWPKVSKRVHIESIRRPAWKKSAPVLHAVLWSATQRQDGSKSDKSATANTPHHIAGAAATSTDAALAAATVQHQRKVMQRLRSAAAAAATAVSLRSGCSGWRTTYHWKLPDLSNLGSKTPETLDFSLSKIPNGTPLVQIKQSYAMALILFLSLALRRKYGIIRVCVWAACFGRELGSKTLCDPTSAG